MHLCDEGLSFANRYLNDKVGTGNPNLDERFRLFLS